MNNEKLAQCKCDDCGWKGSESDLRYELSETPNLAERLDPGSVVPAGECPECGSLAYIITGKTSAKKLALSIQVVCQRNRHHADPKQAKKWNAVEKMAIKLKELLNGTI